MTHFRTLVISNYIDEALAPYSSRNKECFKPEDRTVEYISSPDTTAYLMKHGGTLKDYLESEALDIALSREDELSNIREKRNYARFDGNELRRVVFFSNPNAKQDGYEDITYFNGNGTDDLVFKDEYKHIRDTDEIKLKYIDFRATLEKERDKRRADYRRYVEILGHEPKFNTRDMLIAQYGEGFLDNEKADDDFYWSQPDVKAYHEKIARVGNPDEYMCTEEEYVNKALYPYWRIVTDNEWIELCETGLWGVTFNYTSPEDFNKRVDEAIAEINPETEVHMVYCHV